MLLNKRWLALGFLLTLGLQLLSCAPGNPRWNQELHPGHKAGFWAGIWHGLIIIITFIVSLFTKEVGLYEVNNTGWPYNLGFLIGLLCSIGGGIRFTRRRRSMRAEEWQKISERIEEKVREGLKSWLTEAEKEERKKEWEEIANKLEEKIRRVIKEWVEKD